MSLGLTWRFLEKEQFFGQEGGRSSFDAITKAPPWMAACAERLYRIQPAYYNASDMQELVVTTNKKVN